MIKVEAIVDFTLKDFYKIKIIKRKQVNLLGALFAGDVFECDKEMCDYLMGKNKDGITVIKILEVVPDKEISKSKKTNKKEK